MINYSIQVILFQVLFVTVYDLFLSKETFFAKNRWYLLSTSVISFLLPFLKIPSLQKAVTKEYRILLPEVVLSPQSVFEKSAFYQSINYVEVFFISGCLLFFIIFIIKLHQIIYLIFKYGSENKRSYKLVLLPENSKAFSFFNYIFLAVGISEEKQEKIIQHELVHSTQKHTFDLLFFEILRIVMWFNPMIYVYQNRITLVHEYLSDDELSKNTLKENYINNLLSDVFQIDNISFINQFYKHSLIKKRVIMMTKGKSKEVKQLKYLVLIPMLVSMVLYTSCNVEKNEIKPSVKQPITVYETINGKITAVPSSGYQSKYLDIYSGNGMPNTKEVLVSELTSEEKEEYQDLLNSLEDISLPIKMRIFETANNRKMIFFESESKRLKKLVDNNNITFSDLDKTPTFPGCQENDKECFNNSLLHFVKENFDTKLVNSLGLSAGKKRAYVQFKIDKKGAIIDIKARTPHKKIEEAVIAVLQKLPKIIPGEIAGKVVETGYVLPISFNVE
ncbi:M56 family metallopeptidase [Tenacibaculum finnmarkense]|uniref:BlaR1 peptidase M56 n=1 Tax=Tenacibaculum finnmarkense genomovar finnmarkense TaxID=1458503 RepID=A0AAP1RDH2_9FLAO|nr:M56 family metallopeptidase [Tenacibaculum finnmarkense]MBE7651981.1 BlaR1 peptidase M56 [Tenacibaculum finnmarkense genomovar finnmarkense]MBE7694304.1 BlaR1 peptidase M56 [Tenacibaculum finnmarkense genomovar finnmarkense]MCD8426198.1 M56 family metallopeptidase [Tenacibaculum finnmarkense genomovar finnmarkense]MCG8729990.1 BlaR1 peptidase M56 [Tenacibaculum finnmarkense]MCG8752070.1 BlaR1 peptidase M56 [Tenacibaculum finnmarkense]